MNRLAEKIFNSVNDKPPPALLQAVSGTTGLTSAGFPYISETCFQALLNGVPILFSDGDALLRTLRQALELVAVEPEDENKSHLVNSIKVITTVIKTAAVTAPPDLWISRHVWSLHAKQGLIKTLSDGPHTTNELAKIHDLSAKQLAIDFALLRSRGYLELDDGKWRFSELPQTKDIVNQTKALPIFPSDLVPSIASVLTNKSKSLDHKTVEAFFKIDCQPKSYFHWVAGPYQLELGFRVVPLILAMRTLNLTNNLVVGTNLKQSLPHLTPTMRELLFNCGYCDGENKVSELGDRVFTRGPGPFGIIHAYHSYMAHLEERLKGKRIQTWVARGENVAASQDANRKTFTMANDALDRFCQDHGFSYRVFVEHAVGQGEASRQRFERNPADDLQYFGADLEDAAIDQAIIAQQQGKLPKNMQFIRNADIGQPQVVIEGIARSNFPAKDAVMVVGNGFHEIRQQTNEKMIDVFSQYKEAGFVLIFTEESGLTDEDLLQTAWNTYHAGFRYVHEISGQGLRPALDKADDAHARFSWRKCAQLAGYRVLEDYTTRTRKIFPHPREDGYNPAISVNYFCVPDSLCTSLGIKESSD